MKFRKWASVGVTTAFLLASGVAFAQGQGHGHGQGHDKDKHSRGNDSDHDEHAYYSSRDRDAMRGWYNDHRDHLPRGLAKRDQLPPGLERQLVVRGTLPPGLRKKWNDVRKISNGGCLLHLPIANTFLSEATSCS